MSMFVHDVVKAQGHGNIRALHRNTLEITKDPAVTPRGDCIVACRANKAAADLRPEVRERIRHLDSLVIVVIRAGPVQDVVLCEGSPRLTLRDRSRIIIRKSTYVDDATLCIRANKAAADLDRRLINYICMCSEVEVEIIAGRLSEIKEFLREREEAHQSDCSASG